MDRNEWLLKAGVKQEDIGNVLPVQFYANVTPVEDDNTLQEINELTISTANDHAYGENLLRYLSSEGPLVTGGRPRMLHVTAFVAHEGANRNNDAFVAEDLKVVVENKSLFKNGFAGIIGYNHDFTPIGYWYNAEYMFDEVAQVNGILAHGAIWAWRFPREAESILREAQTNGGRAPFSMEVLSKNITISNEDGRQVRLIRDPIFIGVTALVGVKPGDAFARGVVEETPTITTEKNRKEMLAVANKQEDKSLEEIFMDKTELKATLSEVLGETKDSVVSKVAEVIEAKVSEFSNIVSEKEAALEEATTKLTALQNTVDDTNTKLEEKDVAITALKQEKETLEARITELEEELTTFRTEAETKEKEALRAARYGELSETFRAALEEKPEQVKNDLLSRWAELSNEEWEARKQELNLAASTTTPSGNGRLNTLRPNSGKKSIDQFLR